MDNITLSQQLPQSRAGLADNQGHNPPTDANSTAQQKSAATQRGEVYQYQDPDVRWAYDEWEIPHDRSDNIQTAYVVPPTRGEANRDVTDFLPEQAWLSEDNLPARMGYLEQPDHGPQRQPDTLKDAAGNDVIGPNGLPLRDLPVLPRRISTEVEGFRMSYWILKDPRITLPDIIHRMPYRCSPEKGNGEGPLHDGWSAVMNRLNVRMQHWRERAGMISTKEQSRGIPRADLNVIECLTDEDLHHNKIWPSYPDPAATGEPKSSRVVKVEARIVELNKKAESKGLVHWKQLAKTDEIFKDFTNQPQRRQTLENKRRANGWLGNTGGAQRLASPSTLDPLLNVALPQGNGVLATLGSGVLAGGSGVPQGHTLPLSPYVPSHTQSLPQYPQANSETISLYTTPTNGLQQANHADARETTTLEPQRLQKRSREDGEDSPGADAAPSGKHQRLNDDNGLPTIQQQPLEQRLREALTGYLMPSGNQPHPPAGNGSDTFVAPGTNGDVASNRWTSVSRPLPPPSTEAMHNGPTDDTGLDRLQSSEAQPSHDTSVIGHQPYDTDSTEFGASSGDADQQSSNRGTNVGSQDQMSPNS